MQLEKKKEKIENSNVICPYSEDHLHVVPVCDILLHLAKCRRSYYKQHGIKTELKRCKYNGCHYVLAPEVTLHELTCSSRALYEECKQKMRYPPVSVQTTTISSNLNELMEGLSLESDNHHDLMLFD
ncbi:Gametocyte-specific factor 1-like [Dirofilaria immitis]